jgi:hypothetical protein
MSGFEMAVFSARRGLGRRSFLFLLLGAGCARDALLADPAAPRGHLISFPAEPLAASALRSETLAAEVEVLGLRLGTLESARCTLRDATQVETHLAPIPLVNALHRSGADARTVFGPSYTPLTSEYHIQDGDLLRHYQVQYRVGAYEYVYDNGGRAKNRGRESVPEGAPAHDLHSALLLLRSWRPRLGELGYFYIVVGRRLWRADLKFAGPEVIMVQGAPRLTQRIDGTSVRLWETAESDPRRFSLWLSEDADRVPLSLVADSSVGEVRLTLTSRERGEGDCRKPQPTASR